jgi:hypothetical protein
LTVHDPGELEIIVGCTPLMGPIEYENGDWPPLNCVVMVNTVPGGPLTGATLAVIDSAGTETIVTVAVAV